MLTAFLNKLNMNFHIRLNAYNLLIPILFLFLFSCTDRLPYEEGIFRDSELVELITLDSTFKLDIRYATVDNFVGRPVYEQARAFLQRPAALALVEASKELRAQGYGMIIFDGYRPWSVTKAFWDFTPKEEKHFVADPKKGSRHNRGCAIDLSLYYLESGEAVEMPSEYDEMNESAYVDYDGVTEKQKKYRELLIESMEKHGFKVYKYEWWHFDYKDWEQYRIQNIQFSDIK